MVDFMKCEKCEFLADVFGNFVQCCKTGRFVDYEYWHNEDPADCPLKAEREEKTELNAINKKTN